MLCVNLFTNTEAPWAPHIQGWNRGDQSREPSREAFNPWAMTLSLVPQTLSIYRYRHATEMQIWLWRTQPAFVLCFNTVISLTRDIHQIPSMSEQQALSCRSNWLHLDWAVQSCERSLAITWGQVMLMDAEAEQNSMVADIQTKVTGIPSAVTLAALVPEMDWALLRLQRNKKGEWGNTALTSSSKAP